MNHRILFLPADPATAATCLDVDDDGRVLARTPLAPGATMPPVPAMGRTVLVVAGDAVRIERIELRAHSAAQARAAAKALLSARLARPAELHVALDADATAAERTVASLEPALLRGWLARAEAFGLRAGAVVPEPLLLPRPADDTDPVQVLDAGDRWLVRGPRLAFSAAPALASQVLGDRPRTFVEGGIEALAAGALRPEVDLLQEAFALDSARARPIARRRLAWLALALLASPLVLEGAQTLRLELAARSLDSRARAVLRDALPGAAGDAGALARRLREVREPQVFAAATGALFAAVAARAGTHLVELEYQRGDRVRAVVFHPGPDDIEALRAALAADGWTLVEGGSTETPGGLRTGLVLEPSA
ncbi:type II secretion system protein GspL [Luteimonas granuli]|nr:type II secretion system protein GspL [Luteimonas granuli]